MIKKYETFIKYIGVAIISFLIDVSLFTLFIKIFNFNFKIVIATIIARIISSYINYLLNKNKVFNSNEGKLKTVIKYYILVVFQMLMSAFLVNNLYNILNFNATLIKIPVEFILFICNYLIQKIFIFKKTN